MKNRLIWVLSFLVLAATGLEARQLPTDFELVDKAGNLEISPGGTATIALDVKLPEDHHIYLRNATSMSFNIVTSFHIPEDQGFGVEVKSAPEGEKYETDFILRGKGRAQSAGRYELSIFEQKGRDAGPKTYAVPIVIKTQMCNSKTNVCYKPQEFKKLLRIKITGKKQNVQFRSTSNINWVTSYDEAFQKARSSGKNVFVVITAPEWCGYCRYLERDVFSQSSVAQALNSGFVALRILDTNSDKSKFQFSGYPTMKVADPSGKIIKDGGIGRQESSFLTAIAPFARSGEDTDPPEVIGSDSYAAQIKAKFYKEGNDWILESALTGKQKYQEARRDEKYIILKHPTRNEFLAVPLNGDQGYFHNGTEWLPAFQIQQ
ncbi:MAG: thioredoxin family protein [Leptospiraceae bacterium]